MGAIASFSFYPTKNLAAIGEAGMAVTSDEAHAETLRRLRNHGAQETYFHEVVSGNFRLRWEWAPGSEIFVVYTEARTTDVLDRWSELVNRGLVIKVNRLLRV